MFNIIIRVIIIYIIVIALMRLMGKRQIGEMEPFELVITLIIADLATIPMAEQTIPIWYGVIPLLAISVVHFIFSFISQKSPVMRDIISGKPVIVIDEGRIDFKELKNLSMSCEELFEQLRNLNFFDVGTINYAIIERNGKITVIPKAKSLPVTREDMKLSPEESDIHYAIVENGKHIKRNFKELSLNHKMDGILSDIEHKMLCSKKELAFATLCAGGDTYAQKKGPEEPVESFKIKLPQQKKPVENQLSPKSEEIVGQKTETPKEIAQTNLEGAKITPDARQKTTSKINQQQHKGGSK